MGVKKKGCRKYRYQKIWFKTQGLDLIINSVYAPHSRIDFVIGSKWCDNLTELLLTNNNKFQINLGDLSSKPQSLNVCRIMLEIVRLYKLYLYLILHYFVSYSNMSPNSL